jgi:hypothetical protein
VWKGKRCGGYTAVTLLSHCCHIVGTLLSHCCHTVVALLLHFCCFVRILIVDDAPINCRLLKRTFIDASKRLRIPEPSIVTAGNGQEAVDLVCMCASQ